MTSLFLHASLQKNKQSRLRSTDGLVDSKFDCLVEKGSWLAYINSYFGLLTAFFNQEKPIQRDWIAYHNMQDCLLSTDAALIRYEYKLLAMQELRTIT